MLSRIVVPRKQAPLAQAQSVADVVRGLLSHPLSTDDGLLLIFLINFICKTIVVESCEVLH